MFKKIFGGKQEPGPQQEAKTCDVCFKPLPLPGIRIFTEFRATMMCFDTPGMPPMERDVTSAASTGLKELCYDCALDAAKKYRTMNPVALEAGAKAMLETMLERGGMPEQSGDLSGLVQ